MAGRIKPTEAFVRFRAITAIRLAYLKIATESGYSLPPMPFLLNDIPWLIEGNTISFLDRKKEFLRSLKQ